MSGGAGGRRGVAVVVGAVTIAGKGLSEFWEVEQERLPWTVTNKSGVGMQAVVLGAGPVGILGAMALRAEGFEVWVYSKLTPGDSRRQLIEATGAHFVDADQVSIEEMVNEQAKNLDLVYEATGASKLAFDFLSALGPNGLFLFTGVPGRKAPIAIDTDRLMRDIVLKNQIVLGTVNAPKISFEAAFQHLEQFMERWPAQVLAIISRRFPIDQALEPLTGKPGGIKNVIAIS